MARLPILTFIYLFIYLFVNLFITIVSALDPPNPVWNYCQRWSHQSIYKNGKIFIDGGNEVFNDSDHNLENGYNTYTIVLDTTHDWNWRTEFDIYSSFPKPARTAQGNPIPVVQRGALFAGTSLDNFVYLYGGSVSSFNASFPGVAPPPSYNDTLFALDTITLEWDTIITREELGDINGVPNAGASVEAFDLGLAFYIGGQVDNGTSVDSHYLGPNGLTLGGMIVIDTLNRTIKNYSTTSLGPPRSRGQAVYVRKLGLSGALVYFGGLFQSARNSNEYEKGNMVSFGTITIFDINLLIQNSSDPDPVWYEQNVTGQAPSPRVDFCVFTVSAMDNTSHQVYIYGGQDGETVYDEIWQLTLPSFTWSLINKGVSPRIHHTCHVVAGSQLITLGGISSEPGTPNFTNTCDWEYQGIGIFNLNTENWLSSFNATASPYLVSSKLSSSIGGNESGGATVQMPDQGFTDDRLARFFAQKRLPDPINTDNNTTGRAGKSRARRGVLAGEIAGPVGGVLLLGCCCMTYRYIIKPYLDQFRRGKGPVTDGRTDQTSNTHSNASLSHHCNRKVRPWLDSLPNIFKFGGISKQSTTEPERDNESVKS